MIPAIEQDGKMIPVIMRQIECHEFGCDIFLERNADSIVDSHDLSAFMFSKVLRHADAASLPFTLKCSKKNL